MRRRQTIAKRWATAARWPVGIALTAWRYMWRTTAVHRWELTGSVEFDSAPALPDDVSLEDLQDVGDGVGPLVHRIYRVRVVGSSMTPADLMESIRRDLDRIAPSEFATFQRLGTHGQAESLAVGDEYIVRMPGPWDGPVRVIAAGPTSFRLATLRGHLEAGQIEFRARSDHRSLSFEIESWARSGDRLSDLLYSHLRFSKEVQLHMWTSVLERIVRLAGGGSDEGLTVTTRRVDPQTSLGAHAGFDAKTTRRLDALADRSVNFDASRIKEYGPVNGWHRDDLIERLPHERSGPPAPDGSWHVARTLMVDYQLADPAVVKAFYHDDVPLAGRNMLLRIRLAGLRFEVGVRVGEVYDEHRVVDGREARVFGWLYRTLDGHFEEGQMNYELWKWLDNGEVFFRLLATSRAAGSGPLLLRAGFRLVGRPHQLHFYRQICRRARRLTEAQLESERVSANRYFTALPRLRFTPRAEKLL
jgi:uncharacterized protein (UPF0548 family)